MLASKLMIFLLFSNGFGKEVPVSFEIEQNVSDRIITDEELLWQMILNLLTNACKYTDRGEISVMLSLQRNTTGSSIRTNENEMLLIEVKDTGTFRTNRFLSSLFVK